jgi:hypothetical protein
MGERWREEAEEEEGKEEEVVGVKEPRGFLVKGRRPTSAINRDGFNKVAKRAAGCQIAPGLGKSNF